MNAKKAIEEYLGRADECTFDPKELTGPYGGLINVAGLRYRGLIVSGKELLKEVNETFGLQLHLYDFVCALTEWCTKYVGTKDIIIGRRIITQGVIIGHGVHYFCVPPDRGAKIKELQISNL